MLLHDSHIAGMSENAGALAGTRACYGFVSCGRFFIDHPPRLNSSGATGRGDVRT